MTIINQKCSKDYIGETERNPNVRFYDFIPEHAINLVNDTEQDEPLRVLEHLGLIVHLAS